VFEVSIMTLHASKGLEFETTFLPGWEDGLFPSQRSMDQEGKKGTEAERRLAYVGITRAKRHCVISFASNRRIYNQWQNSIPSRFVDELPSKNVEILNPPGLYSKDKPETFNSNNLDENRNSGRYNSPGWGRLKFNNIENYKPTKTTNSQIINSSEIVI
jgi:DNA helicase-2/ATP-dependent DNA helicase PcrA